MPEKNSCNVFGEHSEKSGYFPVTFFDPKQLISTLLLTITYVLI